MKGYNYAEVIRQTQSTKRGKGGRGRRDMPYPPAHSRLTVPHGGEQLAGRLIMKRRRRHHARTHCSGVDGDDLSITKAIATTRMRHRHVDANITTWPRRRPRRRRCRHEPILREQALLLLHRQSSQLTAPSSRAHRHRPRAPPPRARTTTTAWTRSPTPRRCNAPTSSPQTSRPPPTSRRCATATRRSRTYAPNCAPARSC